MRQDTLECGNIQQEALAAQRLDIYCRTSDTFEGRSLLLPAIAFPT